MASFEAGLVRARAAAVRLGQGLTGKMQVPPRAKPLTGQQLMAKPWLDEGHLAALMRDKDDCEAEDEAA